MNARPYPTHGQLNYERKYGNGRLQTKAADRLQVADDSSGDAGVADRPPTESELRDMMLAGHLFYYAGIGFEIKTEEAKLKLKAQIAKQRAWYESAFGKGHYSVESATEQWVRDQCLCERGREVCARNGIRVLFS